MNSPPTPRFLHSLATCLAWLCLLLGISGHASGQTYWLDSRYDETEERYATAEEACLVGELQRRLHQLQTTSPLPHRISTANLGPENGTGERTCQGVIQRRQFNLWLLAEPVSGVLVYGPLGELPACPLANSADPDSGQCLVAKCDHNCPLDGGNPSNPISSASGNKRQLEADWEGGGPFPLRVVRTYNSQRTADRRARPLGTGWRHHYAQRLVPIIDGSGNITRIRAHRPNGAIQVFSQQGDQWASDADTPEQLSATLTNNGQLQSAAYRRRDDRLETYDHLGRLTHITRADGFEQTLSYTNASPWVQTVTDPQGRTLQFTYTNGQLTTVTLPDGGTIHYTYTGAKLSSATGPDNTTRSYHYGETGHTVGSPHDAHLLSGITDEAGQRHASWTYDHQARATQSMHGPLGSPINHTTLHYQADGSTKITDALGQQRHYQFSVSHKTARLIHLDAPCDACSHTAASKTWDANGHPQSSTDFDGHLTTYTFDARGRQTQKTQAPGTPQQRTTQTDWLPDQNKATEQRSYSATNTLLKTSNWSWNPRGQLLSHTQTDPHTNQSRTTSHQYCESADLAAGTCPHIGLRTSSTDPLGHSTHYSYYPTEGAHWKKGDLKTTTNPLGHTSEYLQYDSAGRPTKVQHANASLTQISYNPRGQVSSVTQSNLDGSQARSISISYTASGQIHKTTRPDGSWLQHHYDSAGRLTKISDPLGNSIHYTLDSAGKPTAEHIRDANNHLHWQHTRSYNLLGRLQDATDANGATTHYQHNGEGHTTQTTDALGRINQYSFDALQREQQSIEDATGIAATIGHSHNALDQKRHTTDPKGLQTHWQHNALADLLHEESPDRGTTSWQHDGAGRLIQQTDARGQITNYSRDALGRITAITYPGEPELETSFQYDSAPATCAPGEDLHSGRLGTVQDSYTSTEYCYNPFGQTTKKRQTTAGQSLTVQYSYNASGQLHTIDYPDGTEIDHIRDSLGRITEIGLTRPGQAREVVVTHIQYAPFGQALSWQNGSGQSASTLTRSLDLNGRITQIHSSLPQGLHIDYTYDAAGNIAAINTDALQYDGLDRLIQHSHNQGVLRRYAYDATGNRLAFATPQGEHTYQYPANSHHLQAIGGNARSYDLAGNLTAIGADKTFHYNARGRLYAAVQNGNTARYHYNARGQRIHREIGDQHTHSLHLEDGRWLGDYDQSGAPIQQTIWLNDHPVAVLHGASQTLYRIESDHLGTPRVVLDPATGAAVWTWSITAEAFGSTPPDEDPNNTGQTFRLDLRFPGQRYDSASGLNHNWHRDYEPGTGRYAQSDPIGLAGGISTYAYVYSNPLVYIDPEGLWVVGDSLPQGLVNTSAGVGDGILATLSFGLASGQKIRNGLHIWSVEKCSPEYRAGQVAGTAATMAIYAGGAIPRTLTHFTTSAGVAGIARSGSILPSTGITLFGDGVYATAGSRIFVPPPATISLTVSGAGFMRLVPNAVFLNGGSFQTGLVFAGHGVLANYIAESEDCMCK